MNQQMTAGEHSVVFNGSDLPSGIYIYKMVTEGFVSFKKLTLVK